MNTPIRSELSRYLRTETVGGSILLAAAAVALIWANSAWSASYTALRDFVIGPSALHLDLTVGAWAQDGLLAIFFFVAGLELKRELVVGELADRRKALLPIIAAVGGVVTPALITLAVGWGQPGIEEAWAIPVATDIAFALGVLALTGSRIPAGARVFLLSLAVVDDLLAIAIIATVFTTSIAFAWLLGSLACAVGYWYAQHRRVTSAWLYVPLALLTWYCMHQAGVHATLAGVLLGVLTRVRPDPGEDASPAVRLEHRIQPWSAGLCVPLFALFAAGVPINADVLGTLLSDRLTLAIILGMFLGKIIGIFGVSWTAVRLGIAEKPRGLGFRDMFALSVLGAIGFTVSLLVTELALEGTEQDKAKAAVLLTSLAASLIGSALLLRRGRVHQARAADTTRPRDDNGGATT